jgi:hypothetical protein
MVETNYHPSWYGGSIAFDAFPPSPAQSSYMHRTSTFASATGNGRAEAMSKLTSYMIINTYVISELYDQLGDCLAGDRGLGSFAAVDEAVGFALGRGMVADNLGALLAPDGTIPDNYDFRQGYTGSVCGLQNKYQGRFPNLRPFCNEFLGKANEIKTMVEIGPNCGVGTVAVPNKANLRAFKDHIHKVESLLATPMVAGALYYIGNLDAAFKGTGASASDWQEYLAEGNAFAKPLLGKISRCDGFAAESIAMGLNFETDLQTAMDNFNKAGGQTGLMNTLLNNLPCLGLVCDDLFVDDDARYTNAPIAKIAKDLCYDTLNTDLPLELEDGEKGYIVAEQYNVGFIEGKLETEQVEQRCRMNIGERGTSGRALC